MGRINQILYNNHKIYVYCNSDTQQDISITRDGYVVQGAYSNTDFSNSKYNVKDYIVLKLNTEKIEKKKKYLTELGFDVTHSCNDTLITFLNNEEIDIKLGFNYFILIPKISKSIKGIKRELEFNLIDETFLNTKTYKLDVYSTPMTLDVEDIVYIMDIPEWIYNKAMSHIDTDRRPKYKQIESLTIGNLRSVLKNIELTALDIFNIEKQSSKYEKKILINFKSNSENKRDTFNHGYLGQQINTRYSYTVLYSYKSNFKTEYFTYKKLDFNGVQDLQEKNIK